MATQYDILISSYGTVTNNNVFPRSPVIRTYYTPKSVVII